MRSTLRGSEQTNLYTKHPYQDFQNSVLELPPGEGFLYCCGNPDKGVHCQYRTFFMEFTK